MKISQTVLKLQSGHKYLVEMPMFNVQRALTLKVGQAELWFMSSALYVVELKIVWSFIKISGRVANLESGHKYIVEKAIFNIYNVQRAVTLNAS